MKEAHNRKHFDLEDRTLAFTKRTIIFINRFTRTITNIEIVKHLVSSAGSAGANYIEANESLGKKDFLTTFVFLGKKQKKQDIACNLLNV